ncbi:hypothetical protein BGX20_004843 [Mortierella sp. AD010]|nr:hypothetical protein BGX20_004843 [Mortierella sp. AD010]
MELVPNNGIPNAKGSGSTSSGLASPHEPTKYTLRCVVDNEGDTFTVDIMSDCGVTPHGDEFYEELVQEVAEDSLSGVHYRKLILYKINILDKGNIIDVNNILSTLTSIKANADKVFEYFGSSSVDKTINIIAKKPSKEDPQYASPSKKIRVVEEWREYKASDDNLVLLPPAWIGILENNTSKPAPRSQTPKDFGLFDRNPDDSNHASNLLVTEQILEIWDQIQNGVPKENRVYRRVLSGLMGVGKTYLSYFLAARGYAEGLLTLYIADARILDKAEELDSAKALVECFLALNKYILTVSELEGLVADYDQVERKTLLIVDEHEKLFRKEPYVLDKFESLNLLSDLNHWLDNYKGSRVIFTRTAHAKYEMKILEDSLRMNSVYYVGPLSETVFSKLLTKYPRLNQADIVDKVTNLTNRVPRELVRLNDAIENKEGPIINEILEDCASTTSNNIYVVAWEYFLSLYEVSKRRFYNALLKTFLGNTSTADFEWGLVDLGLIYRIKGDLNSTKSRILCPPVQKALLKAFMDMALTKDIMDRINLGNISGQDLSRRC